MPSKAPQSLRLWEAEDTSLSIKVNIISVRARIASQWPQIQASNSTTEKDYFLHIILGSISFFLCFNTQGQPKLSIFAQKYSTWSKHYLKISYPLIKSTASALFNSLWLHFLFIQNKHLCYNFTSALLLVFSHLKRKTKTNKKHPTFLLPYISSSCQLYFYIPLTLSKGKGSAYGTCETNKTHLPD